MRLKRARRIVWLSACAACALVAVAAHAAQDRTWSGTRRAPSLDPSRALTQYGHDVWQQPEGLPQNGVTSIAQTPDGYLWVGTEEGLVRFDGLRFVVFDRAVTPAFTSNDIAALLVDREGTLWIGTRGGGLVAMRDGVFRRVAHSEPQAADVIFTLREDAAGRLLVGASDGLHVVGDRRFVRLAIAEAAPTLAVTSVAEAADGAIWIGTNAGVARIHEGRATWTTEASGLRSNDVRAVHVDARGVVWIGTRGGLQSFVDGQWRTWTTREGLGANLVVALLQDRAGTLWVGTRGGGLARVGPARLDRFTASDGLSHEDVLALFEDAEGSLWIGTNNGGLNRLRRSPIAPVTSREGLSHDIVLPIATDAAGATWIGTYGGGLNVITPAGTRALRQADGLSSDVVLSLWPARDGAMWVGTRNGLDRVSDGRVDPVSRRLNTSLAAVHAMIEDRSGTLWIGTRRGLYRLQEGAVTRVVPDAGRQELFVSAILEDARGALWVGTQGDGVLRLADGAWTAYSAASGLPSEVVWSLNVDARGHVWSGTSGGVARYDGTRFTSLTTDHGLPAGSVFQVLDDGRGSLWMSSNKGVFRVAQEQVEAVLGGRTARLTARTFDEADGMKSRECNGGFQPAGWTHAGVLLFPTIRGMVVIDPAKLSETPAPAPVVERVVANGKEFDPRSPVQVAPGAGALEFRYTAAALVAPSRLRFRYRLDGFDTDWVDAEDRRTAVYTNIPPGDYTFRVIAAGRDGNWSAPGGAVPLRLEPRFHQTTAFYGLVIAAALAAAGGAHRWRVRALRARARRLAFEAEERARTLAELQAATAQRERALQLEQQARAAAEAADRLKDDFLATLSHELRTPVNAILGWTQLLQRSRHDQRAVDRAVEIIQRNAAAQARLIEDILDMSAIATGTLRLRPQTVDPARVLHDALESVRPAAEEKGLALREDVAPGLPPVTADPQRLQQIVGNLLTNAIKFTAQGTVTLRAGCTPEGLVVEVIDTGIGIASELLPHVFDRFWQGDSSASRAHAGLGLGLALVRHLVQLHGGTVEAQSGGPGLGATFRLVLPISGAASAAGPQNPLHTSDRERPAAKRVSPPGPDAQNGL